MKRHPAVRRSFLTALLAGLLAGGAFFTMTAPRHEVQAEFSDAAGLVAGNDVRIAGVAAGTVKSVSVRVDRDSGTQFAIATLQIDDAYWPLHQGTRVAVKPKGVLSNMYVDITPGWRGGAAVASDYTFTLAQTQSPVNLDVLSNEFTPDVRTAIRTQIQQGVVALGGGGAEGLSGTLTNLPPLLQDTTPVTGVLADRSGELDKLNTEFDSVSAKLAREDSNLRGLISNANTTLGAIAAKQNDLRGTLENAAATLTDLDIILRGEQGNLQAIFSKGPHALELAKQNADALLPLITAINPHITSLDQLLFELTTATGFNTGTAGGIDTLRVDGTMAPSNRGSSACGGQPSEQQSACPGKQPQGAP